MSLWEYAEDSSDTYILQDPQVVCERTGGEAHAWLLAWSISRRRLRRLSFIIHMRPDTLVLGAILRILARPPPAAALGSRHGASTFSLGSQPGAPRVSLAGGGGEMHIHARQELREDARRSADLQPARRGRHAEPPRPAARGGSVRESRH